MQIPLISLREYERHVLRLLGEMADHPDATSGTRDILHVASLGIRRAVEKAAQAKQSPVGVLMRINRELKR